MKVKECLAAQVVTVKPELSAKEAFGLLKSLGVRHLVVAKEGVVLGIVTDRDLRRPKAAEVFKLGADDRCERGSQGTETDLLKALIADG